MNMRKRGIFILLVLLVLSSIFLAYAQTFVSGGLILNFNDKVSSLDGLVSVESLSVGDIFILPDGRTAKVTGLEDLVESSFDNLNFFANGVLVHNKPDIEWPKDYETFAEMFERTKREDPALCELYILWQRGYDENGFPMRMYDPSEFDVKGFSNALEKRIIKEDILGIKAAGFSDGSKVFVPGSKRTLYANTPYRFQELHGPDGPPGYDRLADPISVQAEALQKAGWQHVNPDQESFKVWVKVETLEGKTKWVDFDVTKLTREKNAWEVCLGHGNWHDYPPK